jgi:cytochrome bd-type quinol oxidase subunit 1
MTYRIALFLEVLGLIGLIYGWAKKSRNTMFVSAVLLAIGGPLYRFTVGFIAGWKGH